MQTVNVINKQTGATFTAVYAPNSKGNMRYNIEGKFYTDKTFDKTFGIMPVNNRTGEWKSHVRNMFDELLGFNEHMGCFDKPFRITMNILSKAAQDAAKQGNEAMIGHFCKLSLYTFSDPTCKEDYNADLTAYYISKTLD